VLDRHPHLVLENCASGGMRMDYALLSRLHLQSTSDQQDFLRAAAIAASAPLAVLPEQAANWAYPQPGMSAEEIAFTMCAGLMGRLYLSGDLGAMSPAEFALVRQGVEVFRRIRTDLAGAVPFWPLGLPGWDDGWLALGLRAGTTTWLGLWRRPGAGPTLHLALPALPGGSVRQAFPAGIEGWQHTWDSDTGAFIVHSAVSAPTARIYVFTH
jgi:alpha-galactosidase